MELIRGRSTAWIIFLAAIPLIIGTILLDAWIKINHTLAYNRFWLGVHRIVYDGFEMALQYGVTDAGALIFMSFVAILFAMMILGALLVLRELLAPAIRRARRWLARRT